jgi:hypothetical protein
LGLMLLNLDKRQVEAVVSEGLGEQPLVPSVAPALGEKT